MSFRTRDYPVVSNYKKYWYSSSLSLRRYNQFSSAGGGSGGVNGYSGVGDMGGARGWRCC